ncbi:MAG: alpha-galactosidase, partial [Spirochaetaceae bacterium]|nr:alpha-galactosidase [Spirochaetaceae bacterium]
ARGGAAHEHYERVIGRITSRVADRRGRPVAWLGCGAPLEASFRHFPLMRIGADTRESWEWPVLKAVFHEGRPAAYTNLLATIGRSLLDGTVFVNDPDVVFCRERGMALGEAEKELVALVDFLLASQIMFSDSAADSREPGAAAFTARTIGLYDALAGLEFGAERLERDVFSLKSRDGRVRGVANLGDRPYEAASGTHDRGRPLVERLERGGGTARFAARSISLFEAE